MGLGTGATAAIIGGIGAAGSVASSAIGAHAAGSAADKELSAEQQALQITQANQQPYTDAGKQSLSQLMTAIQNGTFGPGSIPAFKAPTADEARATPGYQFTATEGAKGILQASAASGGAISGGTAKALESFNSGLADSTYNDTFNRSLSAYQAQLTGQNQAYQQLFEPTQLGEAATQNTNSTIGQLYGQIGQSGAAGTVGTANAVTGGISSATNSLTQSLLLSQLLKKTPASGAAPILSGVGPG